MQIVVVSRWYPSPGDEHSGSFVRDQVEALRRHHEVTVLVPVERTSREVVWGLVDDRRRLTERRVPVPRRGFVAPMLRRLALGRALGNLAQRPDIVHVHLLAPDALPTLAVAERRRIPVLVTEHATYLEELLEHPRARRQIALVLRQADAVVAVSSTLARLLRNLNPQANVHVVPNVVRADVFMPDYAPPDAFAFTAAPDLSSRKGTDLLLRAWAAAFPAASSPGLVIAGSDGEGRYAALASELGLGDRVEFVGRVPRDEVRRLMQRALFYVCASRIETFGVAVAEAISCGRPVVSTRCGGPEDFVVPAVGILVENDDVPALADGLARMIVAAPSYESSVLHEHARGAFDVDAVERSLTRLYQDVLATRTKA